MSARIVPKSSFPLICFVLLGATGFAVVTAAANDPKWWEDNLGGADSSAYAELDQINTSNVARLEVAWTYPYASTGFNPIVVDNVVYTAGRNGSLIALDATSGKEIWIHEGLNGMTGRGVNFWQSEDGQQKRIFFWINSFLQAIDATTGQSIRTFGVDGVVDLREGLPRGHNMGWNSGSPGKVWKDLLILGSTPGEAFMSPPGDIRAYDVMTGRRVWQFHTIPRPGEYGYDTWPTDAHLYSGAANVWGSMSVDDERGIVYLPTGSATYDFYGADRAGMNLYANTLLALDARTGKRLWHFQTIHHDLWDLDNVSAPLLVTVTHEGRKIDAVAHAGKTGFLYVFNRVTGEPLWPIEERQVLASEAPGEFAWPTQPFVAKPPPFVKQSFSVDDVNPWLLEPDEYREMRERVADAINGEGPQGGLFVPPGVGRDAISMPGNQGGSNWGTTAAAPDRGLVFVIGVNQVALLKLEDVRTRGRDREDGGGGAVEQGRQLFQSACSACHGQNLAGAVPGVPSLVGVTARMGDDAIKAVITGGRGLMRPVPDVSAEDLESLIAFLSATSPYRAPRGGGEAPELPPGPVVARGGAPQPPLPPKSLGPFYPGVGGNAGNYGYPEGVEVPANRYMSEYGVHASATKPPYTTLTAYDLNTGEITWQVPTGDHAPTIAAGGPSNTGGLGARNGLVATAGGLVFHAGGDRKFRAYDMNTGQVLWEGEFGGNAPGVPATYEANGRQYVVLIAGQGGGGRSNAAPSTGPTGMIAFALPGR